MKPVVVLGVGSLKQISGLVSELLISSLPLYHMTSGAGTPRAVHVRVVRSPSVTVRLTGIVG